MSTGKCRAARVAWPTAVLFAFVWCGCGGGGGDGGGSSGGNGNGGTIDGGGSSGGNGSGGTTPKTVTVSPATANATTYASQSFTATTTGLSPSTVTWSLSQNQSGGSINASTGAYTAGSTAGTDIVKATSTADSTVSGTATVTVTAPAQPATERWVLQGYAVGAQPSNESGMVSMSEILLLDSGQYRMFYGTGGPSGSAIKYAESPDCVNWTVKGTVLSGATERTDREYSINGPSVLKLPDGRWRMFYQSGPDMVQGEELKFHVRSAISTDGVNFTREGVAIEISSVDPSAPFKFAGHGTYYIAADGTYVAIVSAHYKDEMGPSEIVLGTGTDGRTFGNWQRLYEDWHDPIVVRNDSGYRMYLTYLLEKTGLATSVDGLHWTATPTTITFVDGQNNALTEQNPGVGDFGAVYLANGTLRVFSNYGTPSTDIAWFSL